MTAVETMDGTQDMKSRLGAGRKEALERAGGAMSRAAQAAEQLAMAELAQQLGRVRNQLDSDVFNLMVVGRFKNGKSTFLNALLGRPMHPVAGLAGRGPMPTDELPATAVLTRIRYADVPKVTMWRFDKSHETWTFDRYLRDAICRDYEQQTWEFFKDIREFTVDYPAELCNGGVHLIDSPGLDDSPVRTRVTVEAVKESDAAILLFRSNPLMGESEISFVTDHLLATGTQLFVVVNLWNTLEVSARLKGFVWNKWVHEVLGGEPYAGEELEAFRQRGIYFVNALTAHEAKMKGDRELLEKSGLQQLERDLADFLLKKRFIAHLNSFVRKAQLFIKELDQQIDRRVKALEVDNEALEARYKAIQPRLAQIRARKDRLAAIFERYEREIQREVQLSFEELLGGIKKTLFEDLMKDKMGLQDRALAPARSKHVLQELMKKSDEIISQRIREWQAGPLEGLVEPILDRLIEEIALEITEIEKEYGSVHFALTGWNLPVEQVGDILSMKQRVIWTVVGVVLGGDVTGFGGYIGGGRSVAVGVASQFATAFALTVAGVTSMWVMVPALMAMSLFMAIFSAGIDIERKLKRKAADEVIRKLDEMPADLNEGLRRSSGEMFARIRQELERMVVEKIDQEEQGIHAIMEENRRDKESKEKLHATMLELRADLDAQRKELTAAISVM